MKKLNSQGFSLIEMIIVMVLIGVLMFVTLTSLDNRTAITTCNDYQTLVTTLKDTSKLPAQFKGATVNLDKSNSDTQTCAFNVSKPNNASLAIAIPVEQATKDVKSHTISAIKPVEEDSTSGFLTFLGVLIGIVVIGTIGSIMTDTDHSGAVVKKEEEDEDKKESEKKFKSLKNKVKREKEKEKENLKSAKKVYL